MFCLFVCLFVCLFDLILYVSSTIFQLNRDGSSWVDSVLLLHIVILLLEHFGEGFEKLNSCSMIVARKCMTFSFYYSAQLKRLARNVTKSKLSQNSFIGYNIRIYHECEGRIEKSVPRIAVWHHEACQMMTNGDPEGRIFLSYPHTNNGFFSLLSTVLIFLFIYLY